MPHYLINTSTREIKIAALAALILVSLVLSAISLYTPPIAQVGILLYGLPALFVVGYKDHNIRRWAYMLGICGQPFWFIATISQSQWGMLVLVLFYTGSWSNGVYQHWIRNIIPAAAGD